MFFIQNYIQFRVFMTSSTTPAPNTHTLPTPSVTSSNDRQNLTTHYIICLWCQKHWKKWRSVGDLVMVGLSVFYTFNDLFGLHRRLNHIDVDLFVSVLEFSFLLWTNNIGRIVNNSLFSLNSIKNTTELPLFTKLLVLSLPREVLDKFTFKDFEVVPVISTRDWAQSDILGCRVSLSQC